MLQFPSLFFRFPDECPTNARGVSSRLKIPPESRPSDNEASLVRNDSGTRIETPLKPASSFSSSTFLRSFAFLRDPASFLRGLRVPFPWTARMAVINRARAAGIHGIKRATCCCLHVRAFTYTRKKKISNDRPANPICNPVLGASSSSFRSFSLRRRPMPLRLTLLSRE